MIFIDMDLEEFCEKYGIDAEMSECSCGKKGMTSRPFLTKEYAGLAMPPCKCGDPAPGFVVVGLDEEIENEMNNFI